MADDSEPLREEIVRLLAGEGFEVVGSCGDAEALVHQVQDRAPDLAVVDVRMPPTFTDDGLKAALEIRARWPRVGVLVLSQSVEPALAVLLLARGAEGAGYLAKVRLTDAHTFSDAAHRVADRGLALDSELVAQFIALRRRDPRLGRLDGPQRQVLSLIAEGLSGAAIALDMGLSSSAVERHVTSLFAVLRLAPTAEASRRSLAVLRFLHVCPP